LRAHTSELNRKTHELDIIITSLNGEINEARSKLTSQTIEIDKLKKERDTIKNQK